MKEQKTTAPTTPTGEDRRGVLKIPTQTNKRSGEGGGGGNLRWLLAYPEPCPRSLTDSTRQTLDIYPPPSACQGILAGNTAVDELAIANGFIDAYKSSQLQFIRDLKGFAPDANTKLAGDVDSDGHLMHPEKWGIPVEQPTSGAQSSARRRGKPSFEDEEKFWGEVKATDFQVPTDGKLGAIASRWTRAIKDPELKAKYKKVTGEDIEEAKKEFRSNWAKDLYKYHQDRGSELSIRI